GGMCGRDQLFRVGAGLAAFVLEAGLEGNRQAGERAALRIVDAALSFLERPVPRDVRIAFHRNLLPFPFQIASPCSRRGGLPASPAACRTKGFFRPGMRSTRPRPKSRAARAGQKSLENSRFSTSVVAPICTVSKRRQRS